MTNNISLDKKVTLVFDAIMKLIEPTRDEIKDETGLTEDQFSPAWREVRRMAPELGAVIKSVRRFDDNGKRLPNVYKIMVTPSPDMASSTLHGIRHLLTLIKTEIDSMIIANAELTDRQKDLLFIRGEDFAKALTGVNIEFTELRKKHLPS